MKKTKTLLFAAFSGVVLFAACHKKDEKQASDKVLGKWDVVSTVEDYSYMGQNYNHTEQGQPGDYVDFRSNGIAISGYAQGGSDTSEYKVLSDSQIILDGDTATIKTLTDNSLIINSHYESSYGHDDYTVSLKR